MRRLMHARVAISARLGNERGAAVVYVTVALVVILTMTALVIDLGRVWQERRELQIGATAGALAIAEDCARSLCDAAYSEIFTADTYADANARDGAAAIESVNLDLPGQTVRVVTGTETDTGGNALDTLFAGIMGYDTVAVSADATVAWGTPLTASTLPLIVSDCEWTKTLAGWPGGSPENLPDANDPSLGSYPVATFYFLDPLAVGGTCTILPGLDLPGGFGWVDTSVGCTVNVSQGGTIDVDPGSSPPSSCSPSDFADLLGQPISIPYFNDLQRVGAGGEYTISGHGAFVVAGYRFGGPYQGGLVPCGPPATCVSGWFVSQVTHGGGPGGFGGENRGVVEIKLIG